MTTIRGLLSGGVSTTFLTLCLAATPAWAKKPSSDSPATLQYRAAIEEIEGIEGAYGNGLPQTLMGLGTALQEQNAHAEAVEVFKRAMHVTRINEGLYNLDQVPILERLIESYIADENWEDANDRHSYLFWLHRRNFGQSDTRLLPIIEKLSNWHLNLYTLNLSDGMHEHLITAHSLFKLAVNIIDSNSGNDDLRLVKSLRGLTVTNYFLRRYQAENARKLNESARSGKAPSAQQKAQLEQYNFNSYASGKAAISRIVHVLNKHPDAEPSASSKAKVVLGDWYLLFDKWKSAQQTYHSAYSDLVEENASPETIEALFGHPVALPDMPLMVSKVKEPDSKTPYVMVSFDVTALGKAKNVDIIEAMPNTSARLKSRVRRSLKTAKFRPRFVDGEAVMTYGVTHRYLFPVEGKKNSEKDPEKGSDEKPDSASAA
jgi:hypothetical protein